MSIRVLSPEVANKIAAGEVIERPASVVKELVENAIDAGATQLRVEIRGGGLQLVRVIDDGQGIPADELPLAFERHATSKISSADELFSISTLGFRGEALPSIVAVADVTVTTRVPDEVVGCFLSLSEGRQVDGGKKGSAPGTAISVSNLFATLPARLKFLKGSVNEASRVTAVVSHYAMAYPGIKFSLLNEGRLVFQSSGTGDLRDVLAKVYGAEVAAAMLEVESEGETPDGITVCGYVSPPSLTRATRSYFSFFVNGRWIQSRLLSYALEEAYHTLLPVGRHPMAVLNVELPSPDLDVNVHPGKTEVKFLRDREVFARVQRAVRQTLTERLTVPAVVAQATASGVEIQRQFLPMAEHIVVKHEWQPARPVQPTESSVPDMPTLPAMSARLPILRVLGQTANVFVIAEGPDGLYLIDQHRAHERVLYEKLMDERQRSAVDTQLLLHPLTIDLTARQMAMFADRQKGLSTLGFDLEAFGDLSIIVRAVPAVLSKSDLATSIRELLDQAVDERVDGDWLERTTATMACKAAIKAGQPLSLSEMRELVAQLEKTSIPPTCPHGSPVIVHLSQAQLERQFGRR